MSNVLLHYTVFYDKVLFDNIYRMKETKYFCLSLVFTIFVYDRTQAEIGITC